MADSRLGADGQSLPLAVGNAPGQSLLGSVPAVKHFILLDCSNSHEIPAVKHFVLIDHSDWISENRNGWDLGRDWSPSLTIRRHAGRRS